MTDFQRYSAARLTAREAAGVSLISSGLQRVWRARGILPSLSDARATYSTTEVIAMWLVGTVPIIRELPLEDALTLARQLAKPVEYNLFGLCTGMLRFSVDADGLHVALGPYSPPDSDLWCVSQDGQMDPLVMPRRPPLLDESRGLVLLCDAFVLARTLHSGAGHLFRYTPATAAAGATE